MENTALKMEMITKYHLLAFTNNYIIGFVYNGNIYIKYMTGDDLTPFIKLDKASRGQGYSIRFKPTKSDKIWLLNGAEVLCSEKYFNEMHKASIYNKGEILEKIITEVKTGTEWKKDPIAFTEAGDVVINGIHFQVKFDRATFINEKTLMNLLGKAGK